MTPGTRPPVRLLTAAFLLRGVFFALALPYGDPLDEPFHLGYASFVAPAGLAVVLSLTLLAVGLALRGIRSSHA